MELGGVQEEVETVLVLSTAGVAEEEVGAAVEAAEVVVVVLEQAVGSPQDPRCETTVLVADWETAPLAPASGSWLEQSVSWGLVQQVEAEAEEEETSCCWRALQEVVE